MHNDIFKGCFLYLTKHTLVFINIITFSNYRPSWDYLPISYTPYNSILNFSLISSIQSFFSIICSRVVFSQILYPFGILGNLTLRRIYQELGNQTNESSQLASSCCNRRIFLSNSLANDFFFSNLVFVHSYWVLQQIGVYYTPLITHKKNLRSVISQSLDQGKEM